MRNIWVIAKRELHLYFISPIAYAVLLMIMLLLGIIFYANFVFALMSQVTPSIQFIINPLVTMLLFTTPAITMRTIAEEQKQGTLEILLTAPVRDSELVIGKWFGAVLFGNSVLLLSLIFPIILSFMIKPGLDIGLVFANYLGVFLLLCVFMAIGVFASSLFSNQIASFFITLGILLVFWMIAYAAQFGGTSTLISVVKYLDFSNHFYSSFAVGMVGLKDIMYFISITAFSLFLGSISVESRRWR